MLVSTKEKAYDKNGNEVGFVVVDLDAVSESKAEHCLECNGVLPKHNEIWITTGQDGSGSVEGYFVACRTGKFSKERQANVTNDGR